MSMKAIVKSVLSGDTLVLRGRPGPQGQLPSERILHLAEITAPRLGTSQRDDEPFAFESREYLRTHAVGKEITFTSNHSLPITDGDPRDIGTGQIGGLDISTELLKSGWAKLKEIKREQTDEDIQRKAIESDARASGRGQWSPEGPVHRTVFHTMPTDSQSFMNEWKGKPINAIVEQVRDGTNLRVRLLLSDDLHQLVNISLAGARSPRAGGKEGEAAEPFGEEAKFFVETRLLQRQVTVTLLSLPAPTATPFSSLATNGPPAAASFFIGTVQHPAGNIAEHLVNAGLARVVDWHAGMLSQSGGMEKLRTAEKSAKENKLKLYGAAAPSAAASGTSTPARGNASASKTHFEGQVIRVWSGDQLSVHDPESQKEHRVQLSSLRGPKATDPKQAGYAAEAKEFLRKRLIGKTVSVNIDFIRPKEGEYEERECATIRIGPSKANVAEQLIEKGLATAVRHKRDDENRSPDYDKLMAAEQAAAAESRGLHSGKEIAVPKIVNISDSQQRANAFLAQFKRAGRVPALVDFVAAGSRFKLILPKENQSLTFVLAGIRAPRSARNPNEKPEPFGQESSDYSTRHYLQRDVEVQFESLDKSGGFIGTMYNNKTENVALSLVKEGLATVHAYSAEGLSWSKQLFEAEEEAQKANKNIWKDYEPDAVVEPADQSDGSALKADYLDVIVSDVRTTPQFGFSVQMLNNDGIASLEKLMRDFSLHHKTAGSPASFTPKNGELVSARFSGDNGWYRAKVRKSVNSKKECDVTFIDYGNQETVPFSRVRPLDPQFRSLPGQAQDARLSFVRLPDPSSEYYEDALERFRSLCEGRKLVANIDAREGLLLHLRLMDPGLSSTNADPNASINTSLVREGWCMIDRKGCKYLKSYPAIQSRLQQELEEAKRSRHGMYEFGDVSPEDD